VDLVAGMGYGSDPESAKSVRLQFSKGNYSMGLDIQLPVDRVAEENQLRTVQISEERAKRDLSLATDRIILEVRYAFRQLEKARQTFEIQQQSLELALSRVESTRMMLEAGRAQQRDVLEAQEALVDARNALTDARVHHRIQTLECRLFMGILMVDEKGSILETDEF